MSREIDWRKEDDFLEYIVKHKTGLLSDLIFRFGDYKSHIASKDDII